MQNRFKALIAAVAIGAAFSATPAMAYPGYYEHHYHGSHFVAVYDPYPQTIYYPTYYQAYPVPVPAPVYVQPPVINGPAVNMANAPGQYCREYTATVMIGNRPQPTHGTACYQPDGSWRLMN